MNSRTMRGLTQKQASISTQFGWQFSKSRRHRKWSSKFRKLTHGEIRHDPGKMHLFSSLMSSNTNLLLRTPGGPAARSK